MSKNKQRFRRTPEELELGLTVAQAKEYRKNGTLPVTEDVDITDEVAVDSTGLGDVVETITKATGIKAIVEYFNGGEECEGCKKRKEKWNKLRFRRKPEPLTLEEWKVIDAFIQKNTKRVGASENVALTAIHNRIFRRNAEPSSCASCLRQVVADLTEIYETYK